MPRSSQITVAPRTIEIARTPVVTQQRESDELMGLALAENADLQQQIAALLQRSDQGDGRVHRAAAIRLAPRVGASLDSSMRH
jgi:hypothetical protein